MTPSIAAHCDDCARWNGGPSIAIAFTEGFAVDGPVHWYKSSNWGERGSCRLCGSALFWRLQQGGLMNAAVGALDDRNRVRAIDAHLFVDRKPAFYDFTDDAPRLTARQTVDLFSGASDDAPPHAPETGPGA